MQQLKIYLHQRQTWVQPGRETPGWILGADRLQLKRNTRRGLFIWHKRSLLKAFGSPSKQSARLPAQAQGGHVYAQRAP